MMEYKVATIWITGLSASGKSTLSELLYEALLKEGISNIVLLDGEAVRERLGFFDYTVDARNYIFEQKVELAITENRKGNIVIANGISHERDKRIRTRKAIANYFEVYLSTPVETCAKRDYKDNYSRAMHGKLSDFIGVDVDYEECTENVDLIIDNGSLSKQESLHILKTEVLKYLKGDL